MVGSEVATRSPFLTILDGRREASCMSLVELALEREGGKEGGRRGEGRDRGAREQARVLLRRHPEHLLPVPCSGHVLNAAIRIQRHVRSKKIIGSLGHKICERCGVGLLLHPVTDPQPLSSLRRAGLWEFFSAKPKGQGPCH